MALGRSAAITHSFNPSEAVGRVPHCDCAQHRLRGVSRPRLPAVGGIPASCEAKTMLVRPGSGRFGSDSQVREPITTGCPIVNSRNRAKSSGICQGMPPLAPITGRPASSRACAQISAISLLPITLRPAPLWWARDRSRARRCRRRCSRKSTSAGRVPNSGMAAERGSTAHALGPNG